MKTFKDLNFTAHPISKSNIKHFKNSKQAIIDFDNGFGVSVVFGNAFYSNGIDTYELAIIKDGSICYSTEITGDVIGHLSEQEVTDIMIKVQNLTV